jgi:hypothetical protein
MGDGSTFKPGSSRENVHLLGSQVFATVCRASRKSLALALNIVKGAAKRELTTRTLSHDYVICTLLDE